MTVGSRKLAGSTPASLADMRGWIGWRVDDVNGAGLGRLQHVIAGDDGRPAWLVINEFRFGSGRRFWAPAREATGSGGRVWLPVARDLVRGSSGLGSATHTPQAERRLRDHYGLDGRRDHRAA
jgi:hypothetical protein